MTQHDSRDPGAETSRTGEASHAPQVRNAFVDALTGIHGYVQAMHTHGTDADRDALEYDIEALEEALYEARRKGKSDERRQEGQPQPRRHSFYPAMPAEALDPQWWTGNAVPCGQIRALLHPKEHGEDTDTLTRSIIERGVDTTELWDALAHRMITARRHARRTGVDSPWGAAPCHPPLKTSVVRARTDDVGRWYVTTLDRRAQSRLDPERRLEHYSEAWLATTLSAGASESPAAIEIYRDEATDKLHPDAITAIAHHMIGPFSNPLTDELDFFCNSARRLDDVPTERLLALVVTGLEDTRALANILKHESRPIVRHAIIESIALETVVLARISEQLTDRTAPGPAAPIDQQTTVAPPRDR